MRKVPIAVIDKDNNIQKVIESLKNILGTENIKFSTSLKDFELVLSQREPVIVLIGPTFELKDIEKLLIIKEGALNFIRVILLVKEVTVDLLKRAIKLNIYDVIEFPFINNEDVKDSIDRVEHFFEGKIEFKETLHRKCRKIMFLSAKGGSGSTFIAINTAIALKNLTKREIILFDLKYQLGDVALMLNLYPKNTIFDLISSSIDKLDPEILDIYLTPHNTGVKVLPSPIDPAQSEYINNDASIKILNSLVKVCDYLIIDAPFGFSDLVISFIENIDKLFIVATKDVPSIKNLKLYLQILEKIKCPEEKISVVLNRADSKVEFELTDIEKTINRRIDIKIPSDRIAPVSINKGSPVVMIAPRSTISQNIYKLAKLII
jgi:pilus assembly protein CpaE